MKSELNNYRINNPNGTSKERYHEKKTSYVNDDPHYVKENPLSDQDERFRISETCDGRDCDTSLGSRDGGVQAAERVASSTAAATSVAAATTTAGAFVGAVAATVMTAVIVVTVFVSMLRINLIPVIVGADSITFQVEMVGAQEEDFESPIYATLTSNDGTYTDTREIWSGTSYIDFYGLSPNTEYTVCVKNEEKVFVEKSYLTAAEQTTFGHASLSAECMGEEVLVWVWLEHIELQPGEYYTLVAKNERGVTVFAKDWVEFEQEMQEEYYGHEQFGEFRFPTPDDAKMIYLTLSVGKTTYAVASTEVYPMTPDPDPYRDEYRDSYQIDSCVGQNI